MWSAWPTVRLPVFYVFGCLKSTLNPNPFAECLAYGATPLLVVWVMGGYLQSACASCAHLDLLLGAAHPSHHPCRVRHFIHRPSGHAGGAARLHHPHWLCPTPSPIPCCPLTHAMQALPSHPSTQWPRWRCWLMCLCRPCCTTWCSESRCSTSELLRCSTLLQYIVAVHRCSTLLQYRNCRV